MDSTSTTDEGLRIIELRAENFMRLRAVAITPGDSNTVIISGRNGQGKTSVLDAIWTALGGGAAAKAHPEPIRNGQDTAEVELDLGELVVTRTWERGKASKLTVRNAAGHRLGSPQSILDKLMGHLSFDPGEFARMNPKEQRAALLSVVELPFDPDALEAERALLYAERTDVNREVREVEARLAATPSPDPAVPAQEVSMAALLEQHREALELHDRHRRAVAVFERRVQDVNDAEDRVADLEAALEEARGRAHSTRIEADLAHDAVKALRDLPDLEAIVKWIEGAEQVNEAVRAANTYAALQEHAADRREASDALTAQLVDLDAMKGRALEAAAMPMPGLSFDADAVLFQGVPLVQASGAERLRVSIAMAMALNPTVRVIRVADASLLDSASMALVEQMAAEHGYQMWLEVVDESGELGVVIEDGEVRQ